MFFYASQQSQHNSGKWDIMKQQQSFALELSRSSLNGIISEQAASHRYYVSITDGLNTRHALLLMD